MRTETDERILEHYRQEAAETTLSPTSTMKDERPREFEIRSILDSPGAHRRATADRAAARDRMRERSSPGVDPRPHTDTELVGMDFSPEMVQLARTRNISACEVSRGRASVDLSRRRLRRRRIGACLINILDADAQAAALDEIARVVRPGGHVVLIEAFTDGVDSLNRARGELGLASIPMTHHNLWLDKARFLEKIGTAFDVVLPENGDGTVPPTNFLSTHFFMSRVLYPAVTQADLAYNTEFVKFFRFLPPHRRLRSDPTSSCSGGGCDGGGDGARPRRRPARSHRLGGDARRCTPPTLPGRAARRPSHAGRAAGDRRLDRGRTRQRGADERPGRPRTGGAAHRVPGGPSLRRGRILYRGIDARVAGCRRGRRRGGPVLHVRGHRPRGRVERTPAGLRRCGPGHPHALTGVRFEGDRRPNGAILATHTFGTPCDAERFREIADERGVHLFFDAAHALGSRRGHQSDRWFSAMLVFSLSPTKILVAGEGGIIATNDDELADRCRVGRDYGNPGTTTAASWD